MNQLLLLAGVVIVACILMNRIAAKLPLPSLLLFIGLGMCFGVDGFFKIPFDDYELSEAICSVSLLFVMFYGGFGTNLKTAKPVMGKAFLLSTAGVVMTAALVGAAAHVLLGVGWMEGILIGSVIASTDAASVFNVLRSKQLSLKYNTDSLLELESGSNDPISYMMTILMISLVSGEQISVSGLLLKQILIGAACGFLIGKASVFILNQIDFGMKQGRTIFLFAAVIVGYALPSVAGGNGYLSVYLCGILIGNRFIPDKKEMVHFFDILTEIAQMVIFFLLGLLVTPSQLPEVFVPALLLCLFMLFIGRPVSVLAILKPFGASWQQIGVVSWAGLRGVASIVFSIYVVLSGIPMTYNLFNMVFVIVLLSLAVQGTLLPVVSRKQGCSLSWSKEKEALSFPMEIRLSDRMICWCFVGKNTQNRRMGKFHVLFCFWMCEFQTAGKELQLGKRSLVRTIFLVSCDGTAKVSHLYPDLVMTSGIQMNLCQ